ALAEGKLMPDGRFVAEQVQAKCASKYQATPGQGAPYPAKSSTQAVPQKIAGPRS
ncbi:MAG TPA: cytochrome c maturation protein CcmE, partial [Candidatus Dormibacteraeota bacterium]|nr:cytochrome c maturation protein CcmE [Candidatus Dormibacteraeota bacterium]